MIIRGMQVRSGWGVVGVDLSWPMLTAAASRAREEATHRCLQVVLSPMDALRIRARSIDLVITHGVWNLARSAAEFRRALAESARVARPEGQLNQVPSIAFHQIRAAAIRLSLTQDS